jgi:hypothetical protein
MRCRSGSARWTKEAALNVKAGARYKYHWTYTIDGYKNHIVNR